MTTRKASMNLEEKPSKRRRENDNDDDASPPDMDAAGLILDANAALLPSPAMPAMESPDNSDKVLEGVSTKNAPPENEEVNRNVGVDESKNRKPSVDTACFDSLNNDCLVHIISFLQVEDMNTIAICSQDCREARSNEMLEQTRTGTIVFSQNTTVQSLYRLIATCERKNTFSGDRTHLVIENITMVPYIETDDQRIPFYGRILTGILSLDLSCRPASSAPGGRQAGYVSINALLMRVVPNVTKIDLSHLTISRGWGNLGLRFKSCPRLKQLSWNNSDGCLDMSGMSLRDCHRLTELSLDNSRLVSIPLGSPSVRQIQAAYESIDGSMYLLRNGPRNLERLSIKGLTWCVIASPTETHPFSQRMLMNMVRNFPRLQWLRSDLSAENIATLKAERPEIVCVSE